MVKKLFISLIFFLLPSLCFGAAFTSKATGNWSASGQTTWNEAGVPGSGDTVIIAAGHVITVDANTTIGTGSGAAVQNNGSLALGTDITLTLTGTLTSGNAPGSAMGTLTLGAGSILDTGGFDVSFNNSTIRSNSTSGNWAKVTGAGGFKKGALSQPVQDIVLQYVSFQNTGIITLAASGTTGSGTNQIDIDNCSFVGNGAITFGHVGVTPLNTNMSIDNSDFRDLTDNITISGLVGSLTGIRRFSHDTFYNSGTLRTLTTATVDGVLIDKCVFYNQDIAASTGGDRTIQNSFISLPSDAATTTPVINLNDSEVADDILNNYIYLTHDNSHGIETTGTGGSGTHSIKGNVFEVLYQGSQGNMVINNTPLARNYHRNLQIVSGAFIGQKANVTGGPLNVARNTIYLSDNTGGSAGVFFQSPQDFTYTGDINIANNIVSASFTITSAVHDAAGAAQTIAYSGYNDFLNVTNAYVNVSITSGPTGDLTANPDFYDPGRKLAKWNLRLGSGSDSAPDAITYLLNINGYNTSTKVQSDTPSTWTPAKLVEWVKAGYRPTNGLLREAGDNSYAVDGSKTIGSEQWQNPRRRRI